MNTEPHTDPLVIRPKRIRVVCAIGAVATVAFFSTIATLLSGSSDGAVFRRGDQIAMIGLGFVFAAGTMLVARPRAVADRHGIVVRNIIGGYELPWSAVREASFKRGQPWLTLELINDDTVSVLAVQAVDREYAVWAVRSLRQLLEDAHRGIPHQASPVSRS